MIVTTTSISIRVTPALASSFLLSIFMCLDCDIIDTRNRDEHAENKRAYDHSHHENHQRLEDGRKALDGRTSLFLVNVRHAGEHRVQFAGLFTDGEQMRSER